MSNADTAFLEKLLYTEDRPDLVEKTFGKKTSDYWYWRILSYQNRWQSSVAKEANKVLAGALDTAEKLPFNKADDGVQNLLLRQALINFKKVTPAVKRATIIKLRKLLAPTLDVEKKADSGAKRAAPPEAAKTSTWPSTLVVATPRLLKKKWETNQRGKLDQKDPNCTIENIYTPAAQDFLANQNLSNAQIDSFLRLVEDEAPEVPYLLTFVRKDLRLNKCPFGDKKMHYKLTLNQMELLGKKTAELQDNEEFWKTYAWKLMSIGDKDLVNDLEARGKYLDKLKKFCLERAKNCNNLVAIILYNWMRHQELSGLYDKGTLKIYLAIPRDQSYCSSVKYKNKGEVVSQDFSVERIPCLLPIGNDEPYVRRALRSVFQKGDEPYSKWAPELVDLEYARQLYTEVRLLSGAGNASDLKRTLVKYSGKYAYKNLLERVDIEMSPSNRVYFGVQDPVAFDVLLKNVPELTVSVFEINARAYYERFGSEVDLSVNVDGLTPNSVKTHSFSDPPILKKSRTIEVPTLREKRGLFLIELVGNGQMARMLVRKGELRYMCRQEMVDKNRDGTLGYVFRVVNERNVEVKNARVIVNGNVYESTGSKNGEVFVPFGAENNDNQPVILEDMKRPGSATLQFMKYQTENYRMACGMYVDRESLIEKQKAKVIVRPALFLNEQAVSVKNLKNALLTIVLKSNSNGEELVSTRVVSCDLSDRREFVLDITVPTELREVSLILTASVSLQSKGGELSELKNVESYFVNSIDESDALGDLHLIPRGASGYVLACYGKNGEPIANQVCNLQLTHRYFKNKLKYDLESNEDGLIFLGRLPDVTMIEAKGEGARVYPDVHTWNLVEDRVNVPPIVNVMEKEVVRIPFMTGDTKGPKIDVYDVNFINRFKNVAYKDGYIEIKGLPVGDFVALIRDQQDADVRIHVASGNRIAQCAIGNSRIVELSEAMPLQITMVKGNREKGWRVQLMGINETTRVHVLSTFLVPRFTSFSFLASPMSDPQVMDFQSSRTMYGVQGATSEEYRYIQARRAKSQTPGNLLPRPGLLTAPWCDQPAVTPTMLPPAADGGPSGLEGRIKARYEREAKEVLGAQLRRNSDPSNLEFLLEPSRVFCNLTPDSSGWVQIPSEAITSSQNLFQIIAVDDNNISLRNVILPTTTTQKTKDTRMMAGLDTEKHYAEVREILLKQAGETVLVDNWASSQIETVDDISDVFELFLTILDRRSLEDREQLSKFSFLTEWESMAEKDKRRKYGEFACHEVNFFIWRKDPEFFNKVVKPSLASKFQKDFMDYFMLGDTEAVKSYSAFAKLRTLNTLERALLAMVDKSMAESTLKAIQDTAGAIPDNLAAANDLFALTVESKQVARSRIDALMAGGGEATAAATVDAEDLTRSMQETRWYNVPYGQCTADLIQPDNFWCDVSRYFVTNEGKGPFLSTYYGEATSNLTEMLICLAMLNLASRDEADEKPPQIQYAGGADAYTPGTTVTVALNTTTIVLSKQLKERSFKTAALSVSTNYFDPLDTSAEVDGEKEDKFIRDQMLTQKIYGCRVVITNVSSQKYNVEVLAQIPVGSIPVKSGFRTKNIVATLHPYQTTKVEYYFYFPIAGKFKHYPAHVNKNGVVLGYGREEPIVNVVDPDAIEDTSSWAYYANNAPSQRVLDFLKTSAELSQVDLGKISWRMADERLFMDVTRVLRERQMYNADIWKWSLKHFQAAELEEYLNMNPEFMRMVSPSFLNGTLGSYDPFLSLSYQHCEFWSAVDNTNGLTKERACSGGVTNQGYTDQYRAFLMRALFRSYSRGSMPVDDLLAGCYYMLVQDRVKEAVELFQAIPEEVGRGVAPMSYDYMKAYIAFYATAVLSDYDALTQASNLADKYLKMKLTPSMRTLWQNVANQIAELKDSKDEGGAFLFETADQIAERNKVELSFNLDSSGATVSYKNVASFTVKFYQIDLELQFSTAPFRQKDNAYNFVQPTSTATVNPAAVEGSELVPLPEECQGMNTIVELSSGSTIISKTLYDNRIVVQVAKAGVGEIRVLKADETGEAVPRAYVKVYASTPANPDGIFYKDGFTDMRGRFDYSTTSNDALSDVTRFALLVQTENLGADVVEVANA